MLIYQDIVYFGAESPKKSVNMFCNECITPERCCSWLVLLPHKNNYEEMLSYWVEYSEFQVYVMFFWSTFCIAPKSSVVFLATYQPGNLVCKLSMFYLSHRQAYRAYSYECWRLMVKVQYNKKLLEIRRTTKGQHGRYKTEKGTDEGTRNTDYQLVSCRKQQRSGGRRSI